MPQALPEPAASPAAMAVATPMGGAQAGAAAPAKDAGMPQDFLAVAATKPASPDEGARSQAQAQAAAQQAAGLPVDVPTAAAAPTRPAEVSEAVDSMRGAIKAYREAIASGHPELDETFHAQHNALTALLRAFPPAGDGKAALDEMVQAEMQLAPATVRLDEQGKQEGVLYGLQKLEEAKFLARKAAAALELKAADGRATQPLRLQRTALESLDAAEQLKELEMQKEALELEAKEAQLREQESSQALTGA